MNNITANPFGAAEHCAMDNWAAEYAKKLFITEAAKRTEEIAAEAQTRETADSKLRSDFTAADSELRSDFTAADSELRSDFTAADTALDNKKVNRDEYATETTAGIVTLKRGGSGNNSGLLIGSKGELAVNVSPDGRFGLTRDGAGQIKTSAATEAEIAARTNAYKPIVPQTLKTAVESITGKSVELTTTAKTSLVSAVNELKRAIDEKETMDVYSTTPKQVGTWIDGKPIWRVALPYIFMENGIRHLVTNAANNSVYFDIENLMKDYVISALDNVLPLKICINAWSEVPFFLNKCLIEGGWVYFAKNDEERFKDYITYGNGRWGGYIEFATPASNIYNPLIDPDKVVDMGDQNDPENPPIGDDAGGTGTGGSDITFDNDDETDPGIENP